jgi:hypothetical protein
MEYDTGWKHKLKHDKLMQFSVPLPFVMLLPWHASHACHHHPTPLLHVRDLFSESVTGFQFKKRTFNS